MALTAAEVVEVENVVAVVVEVVVEVVVTAVAVAVAVAVVRQLQALERRVGPQVANGDGAAVALWIYVRS